MCKLKLKNIIITKDKNIANCINDYFANIGKTKVKQFPPNKSFMKNLLHNYENNVYLTPVTEYEVLKEICNLVPGKAPGFDNISSDIIKLVDLIVTPLTYIFNESF